MNPNSEKLAQAVVNNIFQFRPHQTVDVGGTSRLIQQFHSCLKAIWDFDLNEFNLEAAANPLNGSET